MDETFAPQQALLAEAEVEKTPDGSLLWVMIMYDFLSVTLLTFLAIHY